ncbi:hypothetical protein GCM10029964_097460 [Kibdelosporangium lantanae]
MIRARTFTGDVVHLWVPDPVRASGHALCGVPGPAIADQAGRLCAACWRVHGGSLGSVFTRTAVTRPCATPATTNPVIKHAG